MGSTTAVWVDDRDTRVQFTGVWPLGGSPNEYKETVSSSTRVGDSFVVPFYGNSIVVYGTIDATSGGVVTNYSIDGGSPEQAVSQRASRDTSHQQFWASSPLNITQHELTVTMAKVNPDPQPGEGTIWFDYFIVYDPSGHEGVAPSRAISKGGIAGVVLGVLGFIIIIMGYAVWYIRRRRSKKEEERRHHQDAGEHGFHNKEVEGADAQRSRETREFVSVPISTSRSYATSTEVNPREGLSPQPPLKARLAQVNSHSPRPSTTQDGSEESVSVSGSSTGRQNQALGDGPALMSQLLSGITEEERENIAGGPSIHQVPITNIEGGHGRSGGPAVGIMIIDPVDLGNGDVAEGSTERRGLRHVDSGVRLLEEPRLPVESPPVYSQI
ncbi:hypothetical protein P691DRAFT_801365 [Macrolepiota fuliginosa MF-IS2]|uniref:Uncharacterized protein n=1 Tax=Macrolepiota fuliginosa MF-IS2 TaxID=1400762 RepID=A0A9P5XDE8_9AGAR|nr:hypothetical protein P691DRAFT_801365 [Macrolepiota fuliginosa MF-IS2]